MADMHKSTRLGDLLVERGAITVQQLRFALETQQTRQLEEIHIGPTGYKMELGEILIELGFINRRQLDSGLTWQQKLRKTTLVMAFVAPLLTAACGGGAADADADKAPAVSSEQAVTPDPGLSSASSSLPSSAAASSPAAILPVTSSAPANISSAPSSVPASVSSSASSSIQPSEGVDGPVAIYWSIPTFRANGDYLDVTEIGGYELRYKLKSQSTFTTIHIDDGFIDTYYFEHLKGDYDFQIATFDKNNVYSDFVAIPH